MKISSVDDEPCTVQTTTLLTQKQGIIYTPLLGVVHPPLIDVNTRSQTVLPIGVCVLF